MECAQCALTFPQLSILPCGNVICQSCLPKSTPAFACPLCTCEHANTALPLFKSVLGLSIQREPAASLRSQLARVEHLLAEVCKPGELRVDEYCRQLKAEVAASAQAGVDRLRKMEGEMLAEVEAWRVGCLERLGQERLDGHVGAEAKRFCEKWGEYLKRNSDQVSRKFLCWKQEL